MTKNISIKGFRGFVKKKKYARLLNIKKIGNILVNISIPEKDSSFCPVFAQNSFRGDV